VTHIVKLSGLAPETLLIGRWHRAIERRIEASGMAWTHLRPNAFMQNYITLYGNTIRGQSCFYTSDNGGRLALVDARDIAAVAVTALTTPGHEGAVIRLTGPAALSNDEVAAILSKVANG
jgi:uncharacterized protein YbjT (DUF2867 family)